MESTDEASECALLSLCLSDTTWLDRQEFSVGLFTGERRDLAKTLIQLRIKGQSPNPENVQLVSKSEELGLLARKLNTRSIGGSFDLLVDRLKEVRARALIAKVCKKGYDGAYNEEKEWRETLSELENDLSNLRGKQAVKNLSYAHDVQEVLDLIAWRNENPNAIRGYSTGLWKLDEVIDGINQELLYFCAARPSTGKTSIALQILLHVAEHTKKRVVFCSAETSASLIKARCITILSGVPIGRIGRSHTPMEQRKIKEAFERFSCLDFVIDDKSSPTITHSEAGLRRLSQEAELAMVAGDYFQLWQGIEGKKYQSKYAELCDVSVSWKAIAKQFRIPVLMLAQLQRPKEGVYDREQKRTVTPPPQIHEIKECLAVGTTNLWTSSGVQCNTPSSMMTLSYWNTILPVQSHDIPRGIRKTVIFKLNSGRFLQCTPDHKILTDKGYIEASKITKENAVACVRKIDAPKNAKFFAWAKFAGWMLGNGCYTQNTTPSFICSCQEVMDEFTKFVNLYFDATPRIIHDGPTYWEIGLPCRQKGVRQNMIVKFLLENGFERVTAPYKRIPQSFLEQADDESIANLLAGLFETDGSFYSTPKTCQTISYSTTSWTLAEQILWCLARLGIFARVTTTKPSKWRYRICYKIVICQFEEIQKFRDSIKISGRKGATLASFVPKDGTNAPASRIGIWIDQWIKDEKDALGLSWSRLGYRAQGKKTSAKDLRVVLDVFKSHGSTKAAEIEWLCSPYIYWDFVSSITDGGEVEVFDREVPGPHNFVANGIICHNCGGAEQDADGIWLLHRNQQENSTSAELIIGKNRDGPLDKINLTFTPQLYTFTTS